MAFFNNEGERKVVLLFSRYLRTIYKLLLLLNEEFDYTSLFPHFYFHFHFAYNLFYLDKQGHLVSPIIVQHTSGSIGNGVPNGFGPRIVKETHIFKSSSFGSSCGCATFVPATCPPCTTSPSPVIFRNVLNMIECACAPKPQCSPCPGLYTAVHAMALRQANIDVSTHSTLQERASEEQKLYAEAQKYAEVVQKEEEAALEAARKMAEATEKAEAARTKMITTGMHARQLAEESLRIASSVSQLYGLIFSPF